MCSSSQHDPDVPPWLSWALRWLWSHREQVIPPLGVGLAVAALGLTLYLRFAPTDLDRAEAELIRARVVVQKLESDAHRSLKEANAYSDWAAEHRKTVEGDKNTHDRVWLRWRESYLDACTQLHFDHIQRRHALLSLATAYMPLLAEAEGEILRSRTAGDQGHPVKVATRVREILAPILANR